MCQIFLAMKIVFLSSGNVYFNEWKLMEMDFLSRGNSILLLRALMKFLKFGGGEFFKRNLIIAC